MESLPIQQHSTAFNSIQRHVTTRNVTQQYLTIPRFIHGPYQVITC
nr:MAG TPA_asm: hypothetical protein [Caudoviricetes sp.]